MNAVRAVASIGVLTVLGVLPVIGQGIEIDGWRDAAPDLEVSEYVPSEGRSL